MTPVSMWERTKGSTGAVNNPEEENREGPTGVPEEHMGILDS